MYWRAKYLIQKVLSLLPGESGRRINHVLSVRAGNLREAHFYGIHNTLAMCSLLEKFEFNIEGKVFFELGTGWSGCSAMVLLGLLSGDVYSYDLYRHLDDELTAASKHALLELEHYTTKKFPFPCNLPEMAQRFDVLNVDMSRFHYRAPRDARSTGLQDDSVDCYFSQAVLEHVPGAIIQELMSESYRVLKPGGLCCHYIQPTMHAAWMDRHATGIDYLTCRDWSWRTFYENDIAHESRLRGADHLAMVRDAGFEVLEEWHTVDQQALSALPRVKLAPRFRSYSWEELATDYIWILARKPIPAR